MRTVRATETAVSIWLSGEDAPGRAELMALIRQALLDRGLDPWPDTEAECFTAGEELLIIARPGGEKRLAFRFPELEALLCGALACPDGESSLYDGGEGYILTVPPAAARAALWECGVQTDVTEDWEVHAREQGLCLMDGTAISDLRRYFSP